MLIVDRVVEGTTITVANSSWLCLTTILSFLPLNMYAMLTSLFKKVFENLIAKYNFTTFFNQPFNG